MILRYKHLLVFIIIIIFKNISPNIIVSQHTISFYLSAFGRDEFLVFFVPFFPFVFLNFVQ